jgi:hypothetical protein
VSGTGSVCWASSFFVFLLVPINKIIQGSFLIIFYFFFSNNFSQYYLVPFELDSLLSKLCGANRIRDELFTSTKNCLSNDSLVMS